MDNFNQTYFKVYCFQFVVYLQLFRMIIQLLVNLHPSEVKIPIWLKHRLLMCKELKHIKTCLILKKETRYKPIGKHPS